MVQVWFNKRRDEALKCKTKELTPWAEDELRKNMQACMTFRVSHRNSDMWIFQILNLESLDIISGESRFHVWIILITYLDVPDIVSGMSRHHISHILIVCD